jgi:hypothetical protein
MPRRLARTALVSAFLLASAPGQAVDIFGVDVEPGVIEFDRTGLRIADYGTRLTVAGPEGFTLTRHFASGQRIELLRSDLPFEGAYSYELQILGPTGTRTGHTLPSTEPQVGLPSQGGGFTIDAAQFVSPDLVEAPKLSLQDTPPTRGSTRNTFVGDQSFQGNLCVGLDCVNGEGFGGEVIKVKQNNTRLRFQDTSTSGAFPTTDWELTANESSNGGRSQFAITDLDAGTTPFSVAAGAPDGALSVGNGGRVGVGTQTPLTDLHLQTGNTPTLRLDQDGSGGFSGQTWDLGANESEFFLRDTSAFRVPFRVRPGAPTDSLTIDSSGRVGLGTQSPAAQLHLQQGGVGPGIRLVNTGGTPRSWDAGLIDAAGEFVIDDASTPTTEFELTAGGNLTIAGTLTSARSPRVAKGRGEADLEVTAAALDATGTLPGFDSAAGHDVIAFQQAMLEQIKALTERTLEQEQRIEALQAELRTLRARTIRD